MTQGQDPQSDSLRKLMAMLGDTGYAGLQSLLMRVFKGSGGVVPPIGLSSGKIGGGGGFGGGTDDGGGGSGGGGPIIVPNDPGGA